MNNELAKLLKKAADKYHNSYRNMEDLDMKVIKEDHYNLLSIANMIENNESSKSIAEAMRSLDTAVRDVIPDKVYYTYIK